MAIYARLFILSGRHLDYDLAVIDGSTLDMGNRCISWSPNTRPDLPNHTDRYFVLATAPKIEPNKPCGRTLN